MSTLKAQFAEHEAEQLLDAQSFKPEHLVALSGGEASQAFAFESKEQELILRVNKQFDYARDVWASGFVRSSQIPVPAILVTGKHGEYFWSVSVRAKGKMLGQLTQAQLDALVPEMVDVLHRVHTLDVSSSYGFGKVDADGNGQYSSLQEFIEDFDIYGDYIDWDQTLKTMPRHYRELIADSWKVGRRLLSYVPENTRTLCHGNFDMGNVIADETGITGLIDWNDCVYADPLRDVAWTDFWSPSLNFAKAYVKRFPQLNAHERIICYQLFMAARSMGFFLHTNQPQKAEWLLPLVEACLLEGRGLT